MKGFSWSVREDHRGPRGGHGGPVGLGDGHREPPVLQEELRQVPVLQVSSGEPAMSHSRPLLIYLHGSILPRVLTCSAPFPGLLSRPHGVRLQRDRRPDHSFSAHPGSSSHVVLFFAV